MGIKTITGLVERFAIGQSHTDMGAGTIYFLLIEGNPLIKLRKTGMLNLRHHFEEAMTQPGDLVTVEVNPITGESDLSKFVNHTLNERLKEFDSYTEMSPDHCS